MTTIWISNEERDAVMPAWVRRSESLRHYWRNELSARVNMASTDRIEDEIERNHVRAQIRRHLDQRYQDWMNL